MIRRWGLWGAIALCACSASPEVSGFSAVAFEALHREVYRVYDRPLSEQALHQLLSQSFSGEALTQAYLAQSQDLNAMAAAGVRVEVGTIAYQQLLPRAGREDGMVSVEAQWRVSGVVFHGDHSHDRVAHFRAIYDLTQGAEGYRIVGTRVADHRRLSPEAAARTMRDDAPEAPGLRLFEMLGQEDAEEEGPGDVE